MESFAAKARSKSIAAGQQYILSLAAILHEVAPTLLTAAAHMAARPSDITILESLETVVASLEHQQCRDIALRVAHAIANSGTLSSSRQGSCLMSRFVQSTALTNHRETMKPLGEMTCGVPCCFQETPSETSEDPGALSFVSMTSPPNPFSTVVPTTLLSEPPQIPATCMDDHSHMMRRSLVSMTSIVRRSSFVTGLLHFLQTTTCTKQVEDDDDDIVQINDYQIIDEAGRGQFGVVKIAVKDAPDENVYAIKIVAKRKMKQRHPMHRSDLSTTSFGASIVSLASVAVPHPSSDSKDQRIGVSAVTSEGTVTCAVENATLAPAQMKAPTTINFQLQLAPTPPCNANESSSPKRAALQVAIEDNLFAAPARITNDARICPGHTRSDSTSDRAPSKAAQQVDRHAPKTEVVDSVRREIEVMKALRHRNIVNLLEVIDDPEDTNLYLVMPYCDRGPIVTLSKEGTCAPLDVDVARGYMRQITAGLAYLHSKHVAHMDIKPDNILLNSSQRCCLSDFGTSEFFDGDSNMLRGLRGTPAFASPEAMASDVFNPFQADVWSLGVTFYVMLFGKQPFKGHTLAELVKSIVHDEVAYDQLPDDALPEDYDDAIDLMCLMLSRNPVARPSASALRSHPFLSSRTHKRSLNRVQDDIAASRNDAHSISQGREKAATRVQPGIVQEERSDSFVDVNESTFKPA